MPTVNTNTAAQFALNKLNATERDMTTAMERLSSGKRINHAGDDAAGAAIACLLYTSPSPRDVEESRMPSSA